MPHKDITGGYLKSRLDMAGHGWTWLDAAFAVYCDKKCSQLACMLVFTSQLDPRESTQHFIWESWCQHVGMCTNRGTP